MGLTAFQRRAAVAVANIVLVGSTTIMLAPAVHADTYWGAIAHSRDGKVYGRTKNAPSKAAAESAAMGACGYSDCKLLVTFKECGAIAQNNNPDYAGGYGPTLAAAQADALKTLGTPGWIGTWYCNG
ncbi:DUF4189 domain-containing protein [Mycobacterium asiaticum]|uniref:DUF4189 domain-containing protein n=1 Tax=Mycobacterium asiaticum TaxID=1790 RepID=A0A1A3UPK9_MYCAS|nr:DUF4189 domain-containing protein [Mycobacterium asiaticum]OBK21304.1 hypothetical protein A5635_23500 [Mycobacterium asiaticum]OBK96973.1 hypothetical protein A5645_07235 [Mycobacterium asiaticum]